MIRYSSKLAEMSVINIASCVEVSEMEHSKNQEPGLNKSHFTKLHNRFFNKYIEVQKKLQKYKSVESLGDSDSLDKKSTSDISKSTSDLFNEVFDTDSFDKSDLAKCELLYENIHSIINPEVIDLSSSQSSLVIDGETDDNKYNNGLDKDNNLSSSLESINEILDTDTKINRKKKLNFGIRDKVSFRDRIGLRIANAQARRRKISIEKNAAKQKRREEAEKFSLANYSTLTMSNYKRKKVGVVAVAIIEASGWRNEVFLDKQRHLFFRFRLGTERPRSKVQKTIETSTKWQEQFNLNLFDDTMLEIFLYDREVLVGRTSVNLMELEKEKTHQMRMNLRDGELDFGDVEIFILLTISGIPAENLELEESHSIMDILERNPWDYRKLGYLNVKIYGAKGLPMSDYYCALDFENERRLTQTDMKTSEPNWMKSFHFLVTDITEKLIFTVHDKKKQEDIAKITIPLLKIEKKHKRFYALKDSAQKERAQGNNPRILLEMNVIWNVAKASIRVINPKEQILMETEDKIDRHIFARNVSRVKAVYASAMANIRFWKSLFEWESRFFNVVGLTLWIPFIWNFKVWMLPILVLLPFLWSTQPEKRPSTSTNADADKDKQSIVQKLNSIHDVIQNIQNVVGDVARFGERIKNLYNFTEPFLSSLAIFFMFLVAIVLYLIPTRIIFIAWGIKKFLNNLLRPNRIRNNEIMDLLSRVPDDEILLNCEELQLQY